MSAHNGAIHRVLEALKDVGDMTALEMGRHLGITRDQAAAHLNHLRHPSPKYPDKRAHIARWTHDDEVARKSYPRPIYSAGPGDDAPKPRPKPSRVKTKAHRDKKRGQARNSVFKLAAGYRAAPRST